MQNDKLYELPTIQNGVKKQLRRIKKPVFFIVFFIIAVFTTLTFTGVYTQYGDIQNTWIRGVDGIRWGIDIRGGVDVVFTAEEGFDATDDQMTAAKNIIEQRMINNGITDYEAYVDTSSDRVIVRFPWQANDDTFDAESAVKELGETARLTFREGNQTDENGLPAGVTENVILEGKHVDKAYVAYDSTNSQYVVSLQLKDEGKELFAEATERLIGGTISIWMDDTMISYPTVNQAITDGSAQISGSFTLESAQDLAEKISGGALPFKMVIDNYQTISPSLGIGARDAMVLAAMIAFIIIAIFMIAYYRLPGTIAVIALIGQVAGMLAAVTGFFGVSNAFTLTIPGIAGIILSIGMGVDANIISAERIKEEIRGGKTIDGALANGFERGFSAIFDGNITVVIVAFILMGAFGTPDSLATKILTPIFTWFGPSTAGAIYSFGYTLLVGVIYNFIMGCTATRLMLISISKFKIFKKPFLYGGFKKNEAEKAEKAKETKVIDFVGKRKIYFTISAALIAVTILFSFILGVDVDIEFKGGTILTYTASGELDLEKIDAAAADVLGTNVTVTTGSGLEDNQTTVSIAFTQDSSNEEKFDALEERLKADFPENAIVHEETNSVSASSGKVFLLKCLVAVLFAFLLLVIYIAFRFKKISGWSAGVVAIICLIHDVIMVYATFVFGGFALNANFMAVILTILGYSINNTIIIYDRIRENRDLYGKKKTNTELVNLSITQTLTRSINTSLCTLLAMVVVSIVAAAMGVSSIISFSLPLAVGIIVGLYTSTCLAGSLWIWWQDRKAKPAKQ